MERRCIGEKIHNFYKIFVVALIVFWHILIPLGVMGMWTFMASVRIWFVGAGIVAAIVWHLAEKRKAVRT